MSKCLYVIVIAVFFISCNKEVRNDKLLQGEWILTKLTIYDYDGLSYSTDTTCQGDLVVNNAIDSSFKLNLAYTISTNFSDTTIALGKYNLQADGEYLNHTYFSVTNNQIIPANQSRILFLSNAYLKWEYITPPGLKYQLVFRRK